jgi:hypothetical protein
MKKTFMLGVILLLSISLYGCSPNENSNLPQINQQPSNYVTKTDSNPEQKEITQSDAILKAIEHHNTSGEVNSDIDFPTTIKPGETVSKEYKTGGEAPGLTLNLEQTVEAERDGKKHIVILTEDYNVTVSGTKAISFWKYEISTDEVKLIDKKEDGNLAKIIK